MKKIFTLSIVLISILFTYTANAQCTVNAPIVTLNSTSVNLSGNCVVNFDITYNLPNSNGGNKFENIFVWTSTAYAALPSNFYGSQNNVAPSATAINSSNALLTLTVDRDLTTTQCYSRNGSGACSGTQPTSLQTGLTVIKSVNGNTLTYTIKNLSLVLPGACNSVITLVADVWSSQSSSNTSVSCISTGFGFSVNEHNLSGFKDCNFPRMIHFGVYTNSTSVPVKYTYQIYKDNGNGSFDPGDIDVTLSSSITDTITVNTTGPGGIVSRVVGFTGNDVGGENGDYWVVITPVGGTYSVSALLSNQCGTLPVHLMSFRGNMNSSNKVTLNWTIADNETAKHFEIERSVNGKDFTTVALVFTTDKKGTEDYMYYETINNNDKVMYRLKMIDKGNDVDYSKILVFQAKTASSNDLRIIGNPVNDKLTFSFNSASTETVNLKIFDISGKTLLNQKAISYDGVNTLSLSLNSTFKPGMYILEVSNGTESYNSKFIKQ